MNDPYRTQSPYGGTNRGQSPPSYQSSPQRQQQAVMKVGQCPNPDAALSNYLFVAPGQFDPKEHYLLVNDQYVFTLV